MANNSIAGFEATAAELQSIINDPKFTKAQIEEAKKLYALNQERYTAFLVQQNSPNLALVVEINGTNEESSPPIVKNLGDGQLATTTPTTATGSVTGTSIDASNNDLAHVCDFSSELIKDNQLKRFINAQANNIREAIREVMRLLGLSDGTGQFQWIKDSLQSIQRGLKYINEEVIQPILDFEAIVIGYIAKIKKIIDYILSLPAKLLALLQDCLSKLYELVANAFTDITGGGDGKSSEFDDIIKTAKSTAQTLKTTVTMSLQAASTAAGIATIASSVPNLVSGLKKGP
jgi:hypothetical protein